MDIDCAELKRLAIAAQNDCGDYVALNDYGMAMPPAVCLTLIVENERLERNRDMWKGQVERQAEELTDLRKDAERYQWLRSRESAEDPEISVTRWNQISPDRAMGEAPRLEVLDAAIDAAMSKGDQP